MKPHNFALYTLILLLILAISTHANAEELSGQVSGILTIDGSPYILIDDINVENGDSLIIEPGVEIRYDGRFIININGYLEAIGTEEDSILFVPNGEDEDAGGLGLRFRSSAPNCELRYFRISGMRGDARNINSGAAVYIRDGWLTLRNGVVSDNQCDNDAAIELANSSVCHIENLLIEGNRLVPPREGNWMKWGAGIAVWTGSRTIIENCIFRNNNAGTGCGGGIAANSTNTQLVIRGNLFENNEAAAGGGVYLYQCSALVDDNIFVENQAPGGYGGGLFISEDRLYRDVILLNNRFVRNSATVGGGAVLEPRNRLFMLGNEFINNEADSIGGAFNVIDAVFCNGLIYGNRAPHAGAIGGEQIRMMNSVLWANESFEDEPVISAEQLTLNYCNIQDIQEGGDNLSRNPLFRNPEEGNFTLQEDSPMIDTGHPYHLFNDTDGSRCDIGSDGGGDFAVDIVQWDFGDVWNTHNSGIDLTFLWAGQERLNLDAPIFETGENFYCQQQEPFTIEPHSYFRFEVVYEPAGRGEFTDRLFLGGDGVGEDAPPLMNVQGECSENAIFEVVSGILTAERNPYRVMGDTQIPEGETLRIEAGVRIEFTGDYALSCSGGSFFIEGSEEDPVVITSIDENRQGIIILENPADPVRVEYLHISNTRGITVHGDLILQNSIVTENGIDTKAVVVSHGTLTANNCVFSSNGLNVENSSGAISSGSLNVDNCTFISNIGRYGAGLSAGGGYSVIQNCTFENNHSSDGGATYFNSPARLNLINNTFLSNRADRKGGGLHIAKYWPDDEEVQAEHLILFHKNRWIDNSAEGAGGALNIEFLGSILQSLIFQGESFIGNQAGYGGGAYLEGIVGEISNTTFYANAADSGGGIYAQSDGLRLLNSILWANTAEEGDQIHERQPLEIEYSCIEGGFDGEGNIDEDPRFIDTNEGDFHLNEDSPCIDAGLGNQFDRDIDGTRNDMGSYGGGRILVSSHWMKISAIWVEQSATGSFKLFNPGENDFHIDEINILQEDVFSFEAEVPSLIESGQTYNLMLRFESEEVGDFESEISIISEDFQNDQPGILQCTGSSITPINGIYLREGWSMISTNLLPEDNLMQTLFADLVEQERLIMVKDENGQFYLPLWEFDGIGEWLQGRGYLVKVTEDEQLTIVGEQIPVETPIALEEGWNIAAYYPLVEMSPYEALENIDDFVILAKDGSGCFYSPAFGFTNLIFCPTRGYQIKVEEDCELVYPDDERELIELNESYNLTTNHFTEPTRTDRNMSVLINGINYPGGAAPLEIAAFTRSGFPFGSGVIRSGRCGLAVWGDDLVTVDKDGFVEGEEITFRIWDGNAEYSAKVIGQTALPVYDTDGILKIDLSVFTPMSIPADFEIISVSPNPFNSAVTLQYSLTKDTNVHFAVYNAGGQLIFYRDWGDLKAGWHSISLDASKMSSGIYFATLEAEDLVCTKKLLCLK